MEKPTHSLIYKGSISEAINEARRQRKLFVVYISGEDENSILLEQSTWVDQNVQETILKYCVFLHFIEGSVDASQFSAIYPQNAIPSISVIVGLNGVMLWHHEGYISAESLKENIEKSWATLHLQETAATLLATAALATKNPPQAGLTSSDAPSTSSHTEIENSDNKIGQKEAGPTENDESPKKDDVIAASSVKPESDEITKKENKIKIKTPSSSSSSSSMEIKQEEKAVPISRVEKSNDIHVNIRMPNGTSLQVKLIKSDDLRSVKNFVDENGSVGFSSYDLAVPYPRKVFNEQDMDRTLSELGFANRESLIVIPHQSTRAKSSFDTNANTSRDISNESNEGYFGYVRKIVSYVNPFSYFGGNSEPLNESTNTAPPLSLEERSQQTGQSSVNLRYRTSTGTSTNSRPFGSNIHTLRRDDEASDASNNRNMFWNGNSTQFGGDGNNNNK